MSRSPLHRLSAALMAVWFTVFMTVAMPRHHCPMHDGPMGTLAMGAPDASSGAGTAMGATPGAAHDDAPAQRDGHHSPPCTCVGMCACCQTPAMVVAGRVSVAVRTSPVRIAHPRPAATAPAIAAAHRLPFANGPPLPPQGAALT